MEMIMSWEYFIIGKDEREDNIMTYHQRKLPLRTTEHGAWWDEMRIFHFECVKF